MTQHVTPDGTKITYVQKKRPLRHQIVFYGGIALWLLVMLVPCFFIALVVNGQVVVKTGDAPEQELRVWLVQEPEQRGFGISRASAHPGPEEGAMCLQTNVSFVLWEGESERLQYCECYEMQDWVPLSTVPEPCP